MAAEFAADQTQLDATAGGFAVADTAADIAQGFDALNADPALTSISVSDAATAPLELTAEEAAGDQTALGKLVTTGLTVEVADSVAALGALTVQQIAQIGARTTRRFTATGGGRRARCRARPDRGKTAFVGMAGWGAGGAFAAIVQRAEENCDCAPGSRWCLYRSSSRYPSSIFQMLY